MELSIRNLSKTYPNGVRALDDVSLEVPQGMFGLLGPNGAGKSTLMRTIATLQEADSGSIHLGDLDVLARKEDVRRRLGYLPQEFGLYPKVAAEDLLDHFAILKGVVRRGERKALVQAVLTQTNLWSARRKKLGGFSGGMRQRFGIAVALLGEPQLIIVDEPTAGLDPEERVRFLNLLSELGENSVVILSTHIVDDVSELCRRMAIIDRGRILLQGEPLARVAELEGRVWTRLIDKDALAEYQERHAVLSARLVVGERAIRVHSAAAPGDGFEPAVPELEDVYFAALKGLHVEAADPSAPAAASAEAGA